MAKFLDSVGEIKIWTPQELKERALAATAENVVLDILGPWVIHDQMVLAKLRKGGHPHHRELKREYSDLLRDLQRRKILVVDIGYPPKELYTSCPGYVGLDGKIHNSQECKAHSYLFRMAEFNALNTFRCKHCNEKSDQIEWMAQGVELYEQSKRREQMWPKLGQSHKVPEEIRFRREIVKKYDLPEEYHE